MDYFLSEEQTTIQELARQIADEKVKPNRLQLDEANQFPAEPMLALAQADMLRVFIPEEYGGLGAGVFEMGLVVEELSRACAGVATTYAANALAATPIVLFGSEDHKKRFLPRIADGDSFAAFALTEAGAGSDAAAIKTTAREVEGGFVLNGTKQFITNGGVADIYTVIAMTDPGRGARGLSAFLVEKGADGFSFGKEENKMGIRASKTTELIFDGCFVPKENLLGKRGRGFVLTMKTFDRTRPGVGAQAVGIAQGALDEALDYAKQRVQFGKSITQFQAIQFMLADMATQVEAARSLVYSTARWIDSGAKEIARESAMCKLFASDVAMKVTTDAVQIMGGYGYMKEYPVEKFMRDAKITQIYEGTNQIQRQVVANSLIR